MTGVGVLGAVNSFDVDVDVDVGIDVGVGQVAIGTSSTIAVGFETEGTKFPNNGRGLKKRSAAKITVTTSDAELKYCSATESSLPVGTGAAHWPNGYIFGSTCSVV